MTSLVVDSLLEQLTKVETAHQFRDWVRFDLRRHLPHAAFLATIGRLYGVGSVPTHRIEVDFPLRSVEELKNCAGALDDPMIHAWFKSEKFRYVDLANASSVSSQQLWHKIMSSYGMRRIIVHGIMDHLSRRFVTFQIINPHAGSSPDTAKLLNAIVAAMARAAWASVDCRKSGKLANLVGHPTIALTQTEVEIIQLLAQGLSNKEIAKRRGVSDSTVKTQVQRTGAKLGATRRAEIVAIALPMLSPLPPQSLLDYGD